MDNNPNETTDVVDETSPVSTADASASPVETLTSRFRDWRASRAASAEETAEQSRLVRMRRQQEDAETRDRASQAARSRRRDAETVTETTPGDDEIAPLPMWLQVLGVWFNRSFGALPLVAPLIISAIFTVQAGTSAPLDLEWYEALILALAVEGGIWKTSMLYEKTRIEGDSTIGHRLLIAVLILVNASLILSHALFELLTELARTDTVEITMTTVAKWTPALVVALMSTIGVLVWGKQAAYKHRAKLREKGLVDTRAPKFSVLSWILCPWETWWALKHATRYRIVSPILAVEDRRLWKMSGKPKVWPPVETVDGELVSETRLVTPARSVSSRAASETVRRPAVSPHRLGPSPRPSLGPSVETTEETPLETRTVSAETHLGETGEPLTETPVSAPPASETADMVETVGRLHLELRSYAAVGARLGLSKAQAGKYGKQFYDRNGAHLSAAATD